MCLGGQTPSRRGESNSNLVRDEHLAAQQFPPPPLAEVALAKMHGGHSAILLFEGVSNHNEGVKINSGHPQRQELRIFLGQLY